MGTRNIGSLGYGKLHSERDSLEKRWEDSKGKKEEEEEEREHARCDGRRIIAAAGIGHGHCMDTSMGYGTLFFLFD